MWVVKVIDIFAVKRLEIIREFAENNNRGKHNLAKINKWVSSSQLKVRL